MPAIVEDTYQHTRSKYKLVADKDGMEFGRDYRPEVTMGGLVSLPPDEYNEWVRECIVA